MKIFSGLVLISLFVAASASAADVKTPLACTVGAPSGPGFQLAIRNSTGKTLTTDTIINVELDATRAGVPGGVSECFVPDAPFAAGATILHVTKLDRDQNPVSCSAYLSSDHPSVVYANGGSETDCD
ncbi:MAG TPA: hypothetical protein VGT78_07465 [Rhizomicrobium sp.]|nr:hypothetical protein [Rhizomicrobium sp.]